MRKLFYCCTAALLAAGSLTAAAYQVCRYPDSLLGQGVRLASEVALPVHVLRSLEHVPMVRQASTVREEPGKDLIPADPQPAAPVPSPAVTALAGARAVAKLDPEAPEAPPAIVVPEEETAPEDQQPAQDSQSAKVDRSPVACRPPSLGMMPTVSDEQGPPATMPYVSDNEEERPTMPPVGEDEETGTEEASGIFGSWLPSFLSLSAAKTAEDPESKESSEPENKSDEQENLELGCPYKACPGNVCPYTGRSNPEAAPGQTLGGEEPAEELPPPRKVLHHRANKPSEPESPVRQPGVDTMEYRPSDGPLNELGTGGPF